MCLKLKRRKNKNFYEGRNTHKPSLHIHKQLLNKITRKIIYDHFQYIRYKCIHIFIDADGVKIRNVIANYTYFS